MSARAPVTGAAGEEPRPSRRTLTAETLRLAVPVALGNLSHTVVSFSDMAMAARAGATEAEQVLNLAAVGAASIIFLVAFLVLTALAQGTQVLCARRLGEGRLLETGFILKHALVLALAAGVAANLIGLFAARPLMALFSDDPEVQEIGTRYLLWRWAGGMWLLMLLFVFKGFFWGIARTRVDLLVSLVVNVANVFFNWILIFGQLGAPRLGAPGAGAASSLANLVGVALMLYIVLRPEMRTDFGVRARRGFDRRLFRQIARLSAPRAIQGLAFSFTPVFFKLIGDHAGRDGLAASGVMWRYFGFNVVLASGIGTAGATLVGRELGAARPDSAVRYGWAAARAAVGLVGATSLLALLFPRAFLGLFIEEAAIIERAVPAFLLMAAIQTADAVGIVLSRVLAGAGDVVYVMGAEFVVSWLVCLPMTQAGVLVFGAEDPLLGCWVGWASYCLGWLGLMLHRFLRQRWRTIRL